MLFSITGRRLGHVLPRSAAIAHRVEHTVASRGVATSYSAANGRVAYLGAGSSFSSPAIAIRVARRFASGSAASRPKAHTGRGTRASSKNPKTSTTRAASKTRKAKPAATKKPKTKRPKKELTPEEKNKEKIRQLKPLALKPPKQLPATAYLVLTTSAAKDLVKSEGIKGAAQQLSLRYKSLSPSEREQLNHTAQQNKAKNEEAYKQWVRSIPVVDVYRANLARRQLTRKGVKGYSRRIVDDRQIKRPLSPLTLFVKERHASGEMAGIKAPDALKLISDEWKNLPQGEKQKYVNEATQDHERFKAEYAQVFGKAYSGSRRPSPSA